MKFTRLIINLLVIYAIYYIITNFLEKTTITDIRRFIHSFKPNQSENVQPGSLALIQEVDLAKMQIELYKKIVYTDLKAQIDELNSQSIQIKQQNEAEMKYNKLKTLQELQNKINEVTIKQKGDSTYIQTYDNDLFEILTGINFKFNSKIKVKKL